MNQFKIFLFLNCILLLTLVSCNQDASDSEIFRDVVIETEDGFRFQDIDWMTNLENMEDDISGAWSGRILLITTWQVKDKSTL